MIRRLPTVAFVAGLLAAAPAFAGDLVVDIAAPAADAPSRGYASVFAGVSQPSADVTLTDDIIPVGFTFGVDFDTGFILGGTVGTTLLPHLRGEVEFSVVQTTLSEFFEIPTEEELTSTGYNFLANLWYDVDTGTAFTPYVGGGIGWGYGVLTADGADGEINTSGALYQLGLGFRYAATDQIGFDLGYRYRVQPDAEITSDFFMVDPDASAKSNATNHIVQAGVVVGF